ncbi:DUF1033 family protein [Vagococcus sp. DIV0080]|uniref:DUF1033 family protein n=1 Tax=Candidatus Vagococcus giribetii TaxID=2230876 RepID=A0ABS3HV83_9ENTE|nr:DUF1033 family protein [Vagococcus sp. DIV0080]MBO0477122.1 DUF1033 family protein [Vagococcus sp. DIV0080]
MYQVITMYGENEPWWFFEDWQEDIIEEKEYQDFNEAMSYFHQIAKQLHKEYEELREKDPWMVAFWNEGELIYCEDCDEELQAYKGLMILKNHEKLDIGECGEDETANNCRKAKCCPRHR